MSRGKYGPSVDKSSSALINIQLLSVLADCFLLQDSHHPRKLAKLSLVVGLAGDPETDSVGMPLSASVSADRRRCAWRLYIRRLTANVQIVFARPEISEHNNNVKTSGSRLFFVSSKFNSTVFSYHKY